MMRTVIFTLSIMNVVFILFLCGCSKKEVYKGMYEGMNRSQDREMQDQSWQKQNQPADQMSYERYQQERKLLIDK